MKISSQNAIHSPPKMTKRQKLLQLKNTLVLCVFVCLQGVFDHRMKTWQKWQDSQLLLQRKREAEAKLQFTNKPDKLQQAKDEIKEVRHKRTNNQNI